MPHDPDEPDIIITESDLEQFDQPNQRVRDFFANPSPSPLVPVAIVEAMCNPTRRKFIALFEQQNKGVWKLVK